jgi:hypothetical protein
VKGNGKVVAAVGHSVEAELIGHVRHLVLIHCLLPNHFHWTLPVALGEGEPSLGQATLQNLHKAVGLAVVVDRAALAGTPYEDELHDTCR